MDISSLRERPTAGEYSVSELNSFINKMFSENRALRALTVHGEISNFTYHRSGHLYFSLKDEQSQIKAVMFRSSAGQLKFMPENGMKVIVRCSVNVYEPSGAYQLYVTSMQPDGIGALYLQYEQLKAKLEALGMFSEKNKKPIPAYPRKIGVITSPTGAAVRDIINVTGRRYPYAGIYLYPALVQGQGAEADLVKALEYFNASGLVDVIIIGRGGGSYEDLFVFNSEKLAYAIFESKIPIISAVGHETDFTIADFVADLRAPTPSAAAELAVPDTAELLLYCDSVFDRAERALLRKAERLEERLSRIRDRGVFGNPDSLFEARAEKISRLCEKAAASVDKRITQASAKFGEIVASINAKSPLATLARGYSYASHGGKNLKSAADVAEGDRIDLTLSDGKLECIVDNVRKNNEK